MSSQSLGTGRFLWHMATFRPWIYFTDNVLWTAVYCARLLPGLVAQQAFDTLQRGTADPSTIAWVSAAFVGTGIAGAIANTAGMSIDVFFRFSVSAVLQRNMLAEILRRPGARALDGSPGEALSVFRDDVQHAEDGSDWTVDMISLTIFSIAAMAILLNVNATITIFVFVPLIAIVLVAQVATRRLQQSRAASQIATSRVTGRLYPDGSRSEASGSPVAVRGTAAKHDQRGVTRATRENCGFNHHPRGITGDPARYAAGLRYIGTLCAIACFAVSSN